MNYCTLIPANQHNISKSLSRSFPAVIPTQFIEIKNNTRGGIGTRNISRKRERANGGKFRSRMLWKYGTLSFIFGLACMAGGP